MKKKIQKLIAHLGYGSRRKIERCILNQDILVNGKIVTIGDRYDCKSIKRLTIRGIDISLDKLSVIDARLILYNKPEGEICSRFNFYDNSSVFNRLPVLKNNRWISIGRLDLNSSGLLLFTTDGDIAHRFMHPRFKIKREYLVRVFGQINEKKLSMLSSGIKIQNRYCKFSSIECVKRKKNMWFKVSLYEGRNREVRRLWNAVNVKVSRLIRIRYGDFVLPKTLPAKKWIELSLDNSVFSK
ncbi:pseudouridine synthase [Buchnera aphidicola]|uniref:Pseudouridine synthase n=1 Tax=Buchnera aphidicola (Anoecia oenotherae) TaxID=1241833 RepID=A0A4D6XV91_9GAMM|nr:pseudouridine synthase [Buchnera aphidicola]QCI19347.1 pseudouridine synthase [Buchnera aphidicola (Anoecia oenotherae)]